MWWHTVTHRRGSKGETGRMEWVASSLHTTLEHGVSSIITVDVHTSAASSRLNWRPPADLNGLVRFAERRNLPSHFNWPLLLYNKHVPSDGSYLQQSYIIIFCAMWNIHVHWTAYWHSSLHYQRKPAKRCRPEGLTGCIRNSGCRRTDKRSLSEAHMKSQH